MCGSQERQLLSCCPGWQWAAGLQDITAEQHEQHGLCVQPIHAPHVPRTLTKRYGGDHLHKACVKGPKLDKLVVLRERVGGGWGANVT